jgi:hypothetical protein
LRDWARDADRAGYQLSLLLIPDAEEVERPTSPLRLEGWAGARAIFSDAARRHGVRTLDPAAAMRTHVCDTGEPLYYEIDGHWNAAGHRFVAEWLARELVGGDSN